MGSPAQAQWGAPVPVADPSTGWGKPVAVEAPPSTGFHPLDAIKRGLSEFAVTTGLDHPIDTAIQIAKVATNPVEAAKVAYAEAQRSVEALKRAHAAMQSGDRQTAIEQTTRAVPLVGAAIGREQDKIAQGDYAGAVGGTLGIVAPLAAGSETVQNLAGKALPAVQAAMDARAAGKAATMSGRATGDLMTAVKPSANAPYSPLDLGRAKPYLVAAHADTPVTSVATLRDAADSAVSQIEQHVSGYVQNFAQDRITTNPLDAIKKGLADSKADPRDVTSAIQAMQSRGLGKPMTLADADAMRQQLNAENRAVLKKNNYDVATARKVDPDFAAREIAADALRTGIYDQLDARGVSDVRSLRQDEGSLIKIRNAAQRDSYNGAIGVKGTGNVGPVRTTAAQLLENAGTATGAAIGGPAGAVIGSNVGKVAGKMIATPNLTRDALVARAFENLSADAPKFPSVDPAQQSAYATEQAARDAQTARQNAPPPAFSNSPRFTTTSPKGVWYLQGGREFYNPPGYTLPPGVTIINKGGS